MASAAVVAACSVSTPRNGFTAAGANRSAGGADSGQTASATDGAAGATDGPGAGPSRTATGGGGGGAGSGAGASAVGTTSNGGRTTGQGGGASSAVGVTKDSITISWMGGFSGATGSVTDDVYKGFLTWQADVNAHGGIYGRKVIVNKVDHADTPDGAIAACHQVLNNGSFTAVFGSGGADTAVIIANCFEEAHYVNFYNYAVKPKYKNWKYSYSMLTHTDDSLREAVTFIRNKLGHVNEKFGLICLSDETSKIDCDAFSAEAKARGVDLVDIEYIQQNQAQFTSELLRLQKAGAQDVTIHALLESVGILRDAKAIQYTPNWTLGAFAFDFVTEAARDLFSGVTGLRNGATTDMSQYPVYQQKAQQYGTTSAVPGEALIVYGEGVVIGKALSAAGPSPTQATMVNGLDHSVTNWYDEITSPLTYTATDHAGSHYAFPAICCKPDWTWKSLGPPATGW